VVAPFVWWFFRSTWRELDAEGLAIRRDLAARNEIDYRPMIALTLVALDPDVSRTTTPAPIFTCVTCTRSSTRYAKAHPGSKSSTPRAGTSCTCAAGGG
jgi:hypothetical protein